MRRCARSQTFNKTESSSEGWKGWVGGSRRAGHARSRTCPSGEASGRPRAKVRHYCDAARALRFYYYYYRFSQTRKTSTTLYFRRIRREGVFSLCDRSAKLGASYVLPGWNVYVMVTMSRFVQTHIQLIYMVRSIGVDSKIKIDIEIRVCII